MLSFHFMTTLVEDRAALEVLRYIRYMIKKGHFDQISTSYMALRKK